MHAEFSRRWLRILTVFISIFALAGCGEGDGPIRIIGVEATPLPPGGGGNGGVPTLGVFSDTNTDPIVAIEDFRFAGNQVFIELADDRVFDGAVSLELIFTTGGEPFGGAVILFTDADLSAYDTLKFSIDTSSFPNFADLTVQLEPPPGGTGGNLIFLSDYTPVATSGNWQTYEIPLAAFPTVDPTLVNVLGFFNARDGNNELLAGALYLDDIHFTFVGSDSADTGTPIDPEVVLYATEGDPNDDHDDISPLDSGSVIDRFYADDTTYSRVLSVWSGTNNSGADNIAQVGFIGFAAGFAAAYESLDFKVKGMPNSVIFVKLFDAVDSLRINLTSSAYSEALTDGWYQVSIPMSAFNGVSLATGIVFESDDSAPMQFRMLLTDIGFSGDTSDGGDCDNGGSTELVVFADDYATGVSFEAFEGSVNVLTVDTNEAYSGSASLKVEVPADGYTGGSLVVSPGLDLSGYDTVTFWAKASVAPRTLNVAGYGIDPRDGGDSSNQYEDQDLALTTTWTKYTIDIQDPSVLTDNAGLFHFAEGSDGTAYTIWFDDIQYEGSGGGGDCDNGGGSTELVVFADDYATGVSFEAFEGSVNVLTVDTNEAYSGSASLKVEVPADGYTGGSLVVSPGLDLSGYDTVTFWAKASVAPRTLNVAGYGIDPRDGGDSSNQYEDQDLALTTTWTKYTIDIQDPSVLTDNAGLFHFAEGSDGTAYTIWFDDIQYEGSSGGGGSAEGELAVNGDFETGEFCSGGPCDDAETYGTGWQTFPQTGANNIVSPGNGSTYAGNSTLPGGPADNLIKQANLLAGVITTDDQVTINFDARGSLTGIGGVVQAIFFSEFADGGALPQFFDIALNADPDVWTSYTWTVSPIGDDVGGGITLALKIACGGDPCTADVYWDNVSIVLTE